MNKTLLNKLVEEYIGFHTVKLQLNLMYFHKKKENYIEMMSLQESAQYTSLFIDKKNLDKDDKLYFIRSCIDILLGYKKQIDELKSKVVETKKRREYAEFLKDYNDLISYFQDELTELDIKNIKESNTISTKTNTNNFRDNLTIENSKLKWFGNDTQIVYLIDKLIEKGFLSIGLNIHSEINKHFIDENGNPFKNLKVAKQNYLKNKKGKPKRGDELDEIINQLPSE